jgi:hypothetical protein
MAVQKKVKVSPAEKYPLGNAKENKDASAYASLGTSAADGQAAITKPGNGVDKVNMSVAGISKGNYAPINKNGEKTMRGYGAATKGIKTRGPMA